MKTDVTAGFSVLTLSLDTQGGIYILNTLQYIVVVKYFV